MKSQKESKEAEAEQERQEGVGAPVVWGELAAGRGWPWEPQVGHGRGMAVASPQRSSGCELPPELGACVDTSFGFFIWRFVPDKHFQLFRDLAC